METLLALQAYLKDLEYSMLTQAQEGSMNLLE